MKNKITIGDATFYHGDCMNILPDFTPKSIDLLLTDPPYGIKEARGKNKSRGKLAVSRDYGCDDWDNKIPSAATFNEVIRVSKEQIIFGGNYFTEHLPPSPSWIVWDKDNGGNDFADCELAWTSHKKAVRKIKFRWNGFLREPGQIRDYREHPTQKPVGLLIKIINKYSYGKNDTILDPFMGSGTTAIACHNTGRKFIGIEKEKKYFDIAVARYKRETSQLRIGDL